MTLPLCRIGLLVLGTSIAAHAQLFGGPDPKLWSTVDNRTGHDLTISLGGATPPVGNILVKTSGGTTKLSNQLDKGVVLPPGASQLYFDTTAGAFRVTFTLGATEYFVKFSKVLGSVSESYEVDAYPRMGKSNFVLNSAGFLKTSGPAWLTISDTN